MTRDELIASTRQLVEEGERLQQQPTLGALQIWLKLSDDLLATAWGSMDRYHLAWLMVGKSKDVVRGRPMTPSEERAYVREVAEQKTAALRMSLDAVERQGMPFVGESEGVGGGQGMGRVPEADAGPHEGRFPEGRLPEEGGLSERVRELRRRAEEHADHEGPRAPRPDRMQR
jgi:hypothetical protein